MIVFIKIFFVLLAQLSDFEGKVIGVIDGDTIEVLKDGKAVRIRLNGIDCPERKQSFGTKAKTFMSTLVFNKHVRIKAKEVDRYGRTIADVYLQDGTWVNKRLIEEGLAWHYKRYSSDEELSSSEINARKQKLGLWQDPHAIPPWDFRKRKPSN